MCGVAGFLGEMEDSEEFLRQAVECLHRRGPDGQGLENYGWAGMAHTRLSLIDLSPSGAQPMTSGEFSLVFNGEIYNWMQIRERLLRLGIKFHSRSDTEVLLQSVIHLGLLETLSSIRGIFAFAILDRKKQELTLVRDRFGTKPLYYIHKNKAIMFSSNLKVIKQGQEISKVSLEEYLTFQNILPPRTLFEGVFAVSPGTFIKYSLSGRRLEQYEWSNLRALDPNSNTLEENVEIVKQLLEQSIERNLVADVPVGTFLSGGLDSGIIAALASRKTDNLDSFTIGFDDSGAANQISFADEVEEAKMLAGDLGVFNYDQVLKSEDMWNSMKEIAKALEEPRVGQSYPNYFASRLAAVHNKAVMAGTGGDELFGGYPWRYQFALEPEKADKDTQLKSLTHYWHRLAPSIEVSRMLKIDHNKHFEFIRNHVKSVLEEHAGNSKSYCLRDLMYFDMKLFLHGLLHVEDKLSMWHGLEVRVPFLDDDLVNFALSLPLNHLVRSDSAEGSKGKILLRKLSARLNLGIEQRKKQGFTGPDSIWFRDPVRVKELLPTSAKIWDFVDYKVANSVIEDHLIQKRNARLFIWSMIQLEASID